MGIIAIIVWLIVLAIPVAGLFATHKKVENDRHNTRSAPVRTT